jgi:hypothetical protein
MIEANVLTGLILFVVYFVFDIIYSHYIIAIQQLNATKAGILSIVIGTVSAVGIIKLSDNPIYSVPIILGGGLGTYAILKWEKIKKARKEQKRDKVEYHENK